MELQFIEKAGEYQLLRYIEKGLQGKVYLAKTPQQKKLCAIKISNLVDFLSTFSHSNIINYITSHQKVEVKIYGQPIETKNIMVLELAERGQIYEFIKVKRFTQEISRYYFKQLIQGMRYLHEKNIAHRDLKLHNILVSKQYALKIADFGFAKQKLTKQTKFTSKLGTEGYQAPQILKTTAIYDGQQVDMFALGVILFIFVKGIPPFLQATITNTAYKMIIDKKFDKFWTAHEKKLGKGFFSQSFKKLIESLLSYQPNQRPTFQQLQKDPWLSGKLSNVVQVQEQMQARYKFILQNNQNKNQLQKQFDKFYKQKMQKDKMIDQKDQGSGQRGKRGKRGENQGQQQVSQFNLSCKLYRQKFNKSIDKDQMQKIIIFLVWLQDYLKRCQQNGQVFMENDLYNVKPFNYSLEARVMEQNKVTVCEAVLKFEFQTYFQDSTNQNKAQDEIQKSIQQITLVLEVSNISFNLRNVIFSNKTQKQTFSQQLGKQIWKNQIKNNISRAINCFAQKNLKTCKINQQCNKICQ